MELFLSSLVIIFSVAAICWVVLLVIGLMMAKARLVVMPTAPGTKVASSPFVSILVPARNEADRVLRESILSMLRQDYHDCEVIAVDDRSTDQTLRVLKGLEAETQRLRVIHGKELPPDWTLGKVYALEQASDVARGEWLLIADADLILHRAAIRSTLQFAAEHQCDVLSVEIRKDCRSFWEKLTVPIQDFFTQLAIFVSRVNDPKNPRAFSNGGYMLIRRSALASIGGFRVVKDQVPDGVALACRLKQAGFRYLSVEAPDLLETRAYVSIQEMWEGCGKGLITMRGKLAYALPLAIPISLFTFVPPLVTLAALVFYFLNDHPSPFPLIVATLSCSGIMVCAHAVMCRQAKVGLGYAFLFPIAYATFLFVWLGAAYNLLSGRGVVWKGRRIQVERQANRCVESSWLIER
jgi:chlorobactene glucosyltransferase